jgi:hypothetical protein
LEPGFEVTKLDDEVVIVNIFRVISQRARLRVKTLKKFGSNILRNHWIYFDLVAELLQIFVQVATNDVTLFGKEFIGLN